MKKDDNSGVSIKQIMITTLFLVVTVLGGFKAYRIVYNENVNTIQNIESASLENSGFEVALVENTEDDFIYSENINFLAAKIITESGDLIESDDFDNDKVESRNTNNYSEKIVSRGNFVREQVVNNVDENTQNKLLNAVLNEIKEFSEKQEVITNIASGLNEEVEASGEEIKIDNSSESKGVKSDTIVVKDSADDIIEGSTIEDSGDIESSAIENLVDDVIEGSVIENSDNDVTEQPTLVNTAENIANTEPPTEYIRTIDVKATAYCLCKKCCGKSPSNPAYGITASGLKIVPGTNMKVVASDPSVIPLGTEVYIEGLYGAKDYGYAIVADTGSAIKNLKIDLYMDTHQMALNWGVKTVRVYILDK